MSAPTRTGMEPDPEGVAGSPDATSVGAVAAEDTPAAPGRRRNGQDPAPRRPATAAIPLLPGERQAAARDAYRASVAAGEVMSGAELGRQFGMSPQWARQVATSVRTEVDQRRHVDTLDRQPANMAATVDDMAPGGTDVAPTVDQTERQQGPSRLDTGITLLVALVAAAASYGHMLHVAELAGEPRWIAYAWPITVDGLAIAALRRGDRGRGWLLLALAVSVASNILAGYPDLVADIAPAVKAWPPVALLGTHRLLHVRKARE